MPVKIAHFFYNEFGRRFCDYLPDSIEFIDNACDESADLIYCGTASMLRNAMHAKLEYKKPLICWVWDIPYNWKTWAMTPEESIFNPPGSFSNVPDIVNMLHQCDLVISASKHTQRVLREKFKIASEQIYFYTDMSLMTNQSKSGEKGIVQISRIVSHKRFEISIDAVQNIDATLICIGGSKNEVYFKKLQAHAKRNVTFLHKISREQVIAELVKATVLVSPSIFEGWGLSPIEAIVCGTPIILNDMPVFREVYGDAAIYHKQDDVEDLRQKIEMVLGDKQLQKKIVTDCRQIVVPFTPQLFAKRWMKLLFS